MDQMGQMKKTKKKGVGGEGGEGGKPEARDPPKNGEKKRLRNWCLNGPKMTFLGPPRADPVRGPKNAKKKRKQKSR